ncbi:hypothetical protein V8B97DRAFT_1919555 [Scleroderma yunnanense]
MMDIITQDPHNQIEHGIDQVNTLLEALQGPLEKSPQEPAITPPTLPTTSTPNKGITSWGVINAMEQLAMPMMATTHRWTWDNRFSFTHPGDCQICQLQWQHIIATKLDEELFLVVTQAVPKQRAHWAYDEGWVACESAMPEAGLALIGLAREQLEATFEPFRSIDSVMHAFECTVMEDPQLTTLCHQVHHVCMQINCTLQALTPPGVMDQETQEEDTVEDLLLCCQTQQHDLILLDTPCRTYGVQ